MFVHPEIEALRSNLAPQRLDQARLDSALGQWRAESPATAIEGEMQRFARGEALARLPQLRALFTCGDTAARSLVDRLFGAFLTGLHANPLGQVPLRQQSDGTVASVVIASTGAAVLLVQALDGNGLRRRAKALTASFSSGETWEHVLSGSADAELVRISGSRPGGVELDRSRCKLSAGMVNFRDGARETLQLLAVPASLVTLKLQRRMVQDAVAREYRLADGTLVHQAAGSSRESRLELAAALLGRMGRSDAAPLLAAMVEEQGSQSLRWQALRECLGLDTALGFSVLCRIAARTGDPLAAQAGALRGQLLETYPQLKELAECHV